MKKRRILATAIKFHIHSTDKDVILCGVRHGNEYEQLEALGFKPREGYTEIAQGFIDNYGNFLDRKEAFQVAVVNGQVQLCETFDYKSPEPELYSEDLW